MLDGDRKPVATAVVGDAKLRSMHWAGSEGIVILSSRTEDLGYGFVQSKAELLVAHQLPVAPDRKAPAVFERTPAIAKPIFGDFGMRLVDGKWTGFYGGVELVRVPGNTVNYTFEHGPPSLFAVEFGGSSARRVAPAAPERVSNSWLIDRNGAVAATLEISSGSGRWQILNSGRKAIAGGTDPTGDVWLIAFGRNGDSVIYASEDDAAGKTRWYEVPLAGGVPSEVFADVGIDRIYTDPDSDRLLGYLPNSANPRPVMFDPAQQAVMARVYRAFPNLKAELRGWTPSMSHFVVRTSGNGDSGTWYMVDVAGKRADPVGYERPSLQPAQVGAISTFSYKAADGLDMDGILTLPPGRDAKNLPVVIFPHGGPHTHDEAVFDWWAQAFASRGYAVFQPNFRGSTNRDDEFRRASHGEWGRKMQTDLSDGLAALARQGIVDPKRACIMGASYGGYAALAGVTLQQGLYRCAVAVAPVSDLRAMYMTDIRESGSPTMTRKSLIESLGDPARLADVSPRRSASRADAPILLIHGKDDTVVPFDQSAAMASALRDAGKPYELVVLREEDHWLSRAATRKQMLENAMRFVQQHNPAD